MKSHWSGVVLRVAFFLTIAIAGFGQAVHHLWNWLMPTLFGLPTIGFWQAVGLLTLCWVLFGGWRGVGRPVSGFGSPWRRRMQERWEQMTPEEREKLREGVRGQCGQVSASAQRKSI
jgi:hypothetical protein